MSPIGQQRRKVDVPNNLYTAILALALGAVLFMTIIVGYLCYARYGGIFGTP
jgi:hypothetical protein